MKAFIKRQLQNTLSALAPGIFRMRRGQLLVLMYHRILPATDERLSTEQPGMIVHPETLHMHLRTIREHFEIVQLDNWLERAGNGQPTPERACALTFDDGWLDNYEYAYPILVREQAPATIFVVSDMVGSNKSFWPERLANLLQRGLAEHGAKLFDHPACAWLRDLNVPLPTASGVLSRDRLDRIISSAKRHTDAVLHTKLDQMEKALSVDSYQRDMALVDWAQLGEMAASGLVTIGSHTRRHTRLIPDISTNILHDEIAGSRTAIEEQIGRRVRLFCYPNGDASPKARALVARHYLGACSTLHGWHRQGDDNHMIRRIGIHQDIAADETSFLARLSGWI